MNAISIARRHPDPTRAPAEPLYFRSGEHALFGWLHRAAVAAPGGWGVVLCKPFGFEAMSSHLSLRAFAEAGAALGMPALRFDYRGSGDSADLDPAADQVDAWVGDIAAAAAELKRLCGVERVCLLGFRLGALLAVLASARCPAATALVAVAPVVSGSRYLRELRTVELAAGRSPTPAPGHEAAPCPPCAVEFSGFWLSAATISALSGIDLASARAPAVTDLLVLDRSDLPAARAWTDTVAAAGIHVTYLTKAGFAQMMMRPPNLTVVPTAMIAAMEGWLQRLPDLPPSPGRGRAARRADPAPGAPGAPGAPTMSLASRAVERPVMLAGDPLLFGVLTEPAAGTATRRGVILVNSGGDLHIGPRRMHVALARRWAQHGCAVLRMDLAGLGDSDARPGRPGNELFPPSAIDDMRVAVEFMRNSLGIQHLTLGGMCSGAYHSLRAAVAGLPLEAIFMVNPRNFFWQEGMEMEEFQPWEVMHSAQIGRALSRDSWRKLLSGSAGTARVAKLYLHRLRLACQSILHNCARRLRIRLRNDLGTELAGLAARRLAIAFVFSAGDSGLRLLQTQSGLSAKRLAERYRVYCVAGADHNFTRTESRLILEEILTRELIASQH